MKLGPQRLWAVMRHNFITLQLVHTSDSHIVKVAIGHLSVLQVAVIVHIITLNTAKTAIMSEQHVRLTALDTRLVKLNIHDVLGHDAHHP